MACNAPAGSVAATGPVPVAALTLKATRERAALAAEQHFERMVDPASSATGRRGGENGHKSSANVFVEGQPSVNDRWGDRVQTSEIQSFFRIPICRFWF